MFKKIMMASLVLLPYVCEASNPNDTATITITVQNNTTQTLQVGNFIKADNDDIGNNSYNQAYGAISTVPYGGIPPGQSASIKESVNTDVVLAYFIGPYTLTMQEGKRGSTDFKDAINSTLSAYNTPESGQAFWDKSKIFWWNIYAPGGSSISSNYISQNATVSCKMYSGSYDCQVNNIVTINNLPQTPPTAPT